MSLWAEYGPRYGGVLVLIAVLILLIHFRRRRERRLASGWKLVALDKKFLKNVDDLHTALLMFLVAAWISDLKKCTVVILVLWFICGLIPRTRWIAPHRAEPMS